MVEQTIEMDTLDIADLEYEVGGTNALEPNESAVSHSDTVVIWQPA
jgi:hypothetical protein